MGVADHFKNEPRDRILERLEKEAEKMGLYLKHAGFGSPPEQDPDHPDPDPPVFLQAVFQVGERAFSPELQAEDEEDKEFAEKFKALEASFNDPTQDVRQELARGMRQGKGILDLDLGDDSDIIE